MTDELGELYRISIRLSGSNAPWRLVFNYVPTANVIPLLNRIRLGEYKKDGIDFKKVRSIKIEKIG